MTGFGSSTAFAARLTGTLHEALRLLPRPIPQLPSNSQLRLVGVGPRVGHAEDASARV